MYDIYSLQRVFTMFGLHKISNTKSFLRSGASTQRLPTFHFKGKHFSSENGVLSGQRDLNISDRCVEVLNHMLQVILHVS